MKKAILIISILMVSIVGTSLVQAQETGEVEGFDFFSWLSHTFGFEEFSVVGDYRQCGNSPMYTSNVIPQMTNLGPNANADNICASGHALIDVFDANWNPLGEFVDDASWLLCTDPDGCRFEVYCCPHDECSSDSECESWYGSGSNCVTRNADDPNIQYYGGDTFRYCTEPTGEQVTCWYYPGTGDDCLDRTYLGQSVCPDTYMGYDLFSSRNQCESQLCYDTSEKTCYNDKSYYVDSCGNRGGLSQDCTALDLVCVGAGVCQYSDDPYCGDGNIDSNEECDDSNTADGDGCSSDCEIEDSGNGDGGDRETITWSAFYSMSDESFSRKAEHCQSDSECSLIEGYDVSCIENDAFLERVYDSTRDACDDNLGWLDEISNLLERIAGGLAPDDLCGWLSESYNDFKDEFTGSKFCVAESTTWYGELWDDALKVVGTLGLPPQYVLIVTIILILLVLGTLINIIK